MIGYRFVCQRKLALAAAHIHRARGCTMESVWRSSRRQVFFEPKSAAAEVLGKRSRGTSELTLSAWRALALLGLAAGLAGAQRLSSGPMELDLSKVKWTNLAVDGSIQGAILRVDSLTGATQVLWRYSANLKSTCEWHGVNEVNVIVAGSAIVRRSGQTSEPLGIGGFSYVPKGTRFQLLIGPATTTILSSFDGPIDSHRVNDTECGPPKGSH
jgi:hypothetical protein